MGIFVRTRKPAAQFQSIHIGHRKIGDDQVRRPILHNLQRGLAIVRHANVIALTGKTGAQHPRNLGLIVYHEDAAAFVHPRIRRLLGNNVNIHRRCIPQKLVDGGEIKVSFYPHGRRTPKHNLSDVLLADKIRHHFGDTFPCALFNLRTYIFRELDVRRQRLLVRLAPGPWPKSTYTT